LSRITLWPHQEQAVDAVLGEIAQGGRVLAVAACGTGKTRIGAEVSRRLGPGQRMVVVPTLELLAQTAGAYAAYLRGELGKIAAVCSSREATDLVDVQDDLQRIRAGVTTDPAVLTAIVDRWRHLTVFCTYQSLCVLAAAHAEHGLPAWDLITVDEAHRCAGAAGKKWAVVTRDAEMPADRRRFMTATPRILVAPSDDTAGAVSMDDPAIFGREVYRLSFAEAIELKLLADYRVVVAVMTGQEVRQTLINVPMLNVGHKTIPADMLAAQIALLKTCRRFGLRRVITYHSRVANAVKFATTVEAAAEVLPDGDRPVAVHGEFISGGMRLAVRRQVLNQLDNPGDKTVIVSNARVLGEGVDIPELDGVMFVDPRDSPIDIVQAVGRAVRRGHTPDKIATIIVPVFLDEGESAQAALEGSKFALVWRVVQALRAHDERVAGWLDTARLSLARGEPAEQARRPPAWLHVTGVDLSSDLAGAITVRMVNALSLRWDEMFAAAKRYLAVFGHLLPEKSYVDAQDVAVGRWIHNLRVRNRVGEIPADRVAAMTDLGMVWEPRKAEQARKFAELERYVRIHRTCDIPEECVFDNFNIGLFVRYLRTRRKANRLLPEEIARLDRIGFIWEKGRSIPEWDRGIAACAEFHQVHGHLRVPSQWRSADGLALQAWQSGRRRNRAQGLLTCEQIAELDRLGFVWEGERNFVDWDRGMAACQEHYDLRGHLRPRSTWKSKDGLYLSAWLRNRRRARAKGLVTQEQIHQLDRFGMRW
jgi:superfamily II DNA or RNA helicase